MRGAGASAAGPPPGRAHEGRSYCTRGSSRPPAPRSSGNARDEGRTASRGDRGRGLQTGDTGNEDATPTPDAAVRAPRRLRPVGSARAAAATAAHRSSDATCCDSGPLPPAAATPEGDASARPAWDSSRPGPRGRGPAGRGPTCGRRAEAVSSPAPGAADSRHSPPRLRTPATGAAPSARSRLGRPSVSVAASPSSRGRAASASLRARGPGRPLAPRPDFRPGRRDFRPGAARPLRPRRFRCGRGPAARRAGARVRSCCLSRPGPRPAGGHPCAGPGIARLACRPGGPVRSCGPRRPRAWPWWPRCSHPAPGTMRIGARRKLRLTARLRSSLRVGAARSSRLGHGQALAHPPRPGPTKAEAGHGTATELGRHQPPR